MISSELNQGNLKNFAPQVVGQASPCIVHTGRASTLAVESPTLWRDLLWQRCHRHHLPAFASSLVSRVTRSLTTRELLLYNANSQLPWATAITRSAVGGRLSQEGGSLSGSPLTHERKLSSFVPSGAVSNWAPEVLGTKSKSTL